MWPTVIPPFIITTQSKAAQNEAASSGSTLDDEGNRLQIPSDISTPFIPYPRFPSCKTPGQHIPTVIGQ
jgi:hypothetical protein